MCFIVDQILYIAGYSFVLNNESTNQRICKVKLESKCTSMGMHVLFDGLDTPLEGRMMVNGNTGMYDYC